MRVVGGTYRGKKIIAPDSLKTRPTADRARESLFNILNSWLLKQGKTWSEISFADVFSGTGAIGIEALSRGAKEVFCFENDREALRCLRQNTNGMERINIVSGDALNPLVHSAVSIIFMDAPYGKGLWQESLNQFNQKGWIDDETLIIIETDKKLNEMLPAGYELLQERSAGRNVFLFAKKQKED